MRFHQVKELVRWAADYHGRLEAAYTELAGDAGDRERMALEYLADHERRMQAELETYFGDGDDHRRVLETWFDDPADFPHPPVLERFPASLSGSGVEALLSLALTQHRTLQDLYRHRAEQAVGGEERDFFEALVQGEDAEVRRLARDMQRLEAY